MYVIIAQRSKCSTPDIYGPFKIGSKRATKAYHYCLARYKIVRVVVPRKVPNK